MKIKDELSLVCGIVVAVNAVAASDFIAKPGDDLVAVRDRVRAERAKNGSSVTVWMEDGVYAFTNCLALGPEDANTIWRARHPGKVTVVGGPLAERAVPLQECGQGVGSLRESTNLWAINVPEGLRERFAKPLPGGEFPVFSVDGRYMMPARWPNGGKFHFMNKERFVHGDKVNGVATNSVIHPPTDRSRTWNLKDANAYAFSDWLGDLSDARVDILRRTMAPHRLYAKVRPVDLFESELANVWHLGDRGHEVFGVFNWDETNTLAKAYADAYAGLDPKATYVGFDYWENRFIAPFKGALRLSLGPTSCAVLQLAELRDRPVLVSTSRHVASPLFDVTDERWDGVALSGRSTVVPGDRYELRFVMPRGFRVGTFTGADDAKVTVEGETVRVAFVPKTGKVAWAISFDEIELREDEWHADFYLN